MADQWTYREGNPELATSGMWYNSDGSLAAYEKPPDAPEGSKVVGYYDQSASTGGAGSTSLLQMPDGKVYQYNQYTGTMGPLYSDGTLATATKATAAAKGANDLAHTQHLAADEKQSGLYSKLGLAAIAALSGGALSGMMGGAEVGAADLGASYEGLSSAGLSGGTNGLDALMYPNFEVPIGADAATAGGAGMDTAGFEGLTAADAGISAPAGIEAPSADFTKFGDLFTKAPIDPTTGLPQVYTPSMLDSIKGGIGELINNVPPGVKSLYDMLPSGTIPLLATVLGAKTLAGTKSATASVGTQTPGTIRPSAFMQAKNPNYKAPVYGADGTFTPGSGSKLLQGYIAGTPYQAAHGGQVPDGGIASLGSYSDGGRLLRGPGTGLSDEIPASINGTQEARLADGEFVVPADVVSALGGGSTESGSKKLYAMLDRVRQQAHGRKAQIKKVSDKTMPV